MNRHARDLDLDLIELFNTLLENSGARVSDVISQRDFDEMERYVRESRLATTRNELIDAIHALLYKPPAGKSLNTIHAEHDRQAPIIRDIEQKMNQFIAAAQLARWKK